jgi:hypothetical protein
MLQCILLGALKWALQPCTDSAGRFPGPFSEVGKAGGQSGAPAGSRRSRALDVKEKHLRRSLAIPVYNQEAVVAELLRRTTAGLDSLPGGPHETVLADDGSFGP